MMSLEIARQISSQIPGVTPSRIIDLVVQMNDSGTFFRGVRYQQEWDDSKVQGVKALGSEGGGVSYWSSGNRVFNANGSDHLQPYDTTFFHYSTGVHVGRNRMYMFATDKNRTPGFFSPDSFIQVDHDLLPNQLTMLEVVGRPFECLANIYIDMIVNLEDFVSGRIT